VSGYLPLVLVLAGAAAVVLFGDGVSAAAGARVRPVRASPFMSGGEPAENAMSRYHARWYAMSLVFLAHPWGAIAGSLAVAVLTHGYIGLRQLPPPAGLP